MTIQIKEANRTQNTKKVEPDKEILHITLQSKTKSSEKKRSGLKQAREKDQDTHKGRPMEQELMFNANSK